MNINIIVLNWLKKLNYQRNNSNIYKQSHNLKNNIIFNNFFNKINNDYNNKIPNVKNVLNCENDY